MREKLSCKLSPGAKKRGVKEVKAKCCSLKSLDKVCNKCSSIPVKTFGNVKEKVELTVRPIRSKLVKSPELTSPNEVKKVVAKQSKAMNSTYKVTHSILSSVKNGTAGLLVGKEKTIPIKVGYSKEGNKLLKKPVKQKNSQCINKPVIKNQPKQTEIKKHKKDKLNVVISKKTNNQQPTTTTTNQDTFSIFQDIKKQARIIHTDSFFQHLFLHNADVPQVKKCLTWIANKQRQVDNKKRILISDAAARLYLNLTKPVTRSKFRSLDEAVRSRSESPRRDFGLEVKVRSVSLPPQLKRSKIPLRVRVEKSLVGCVSPSGSLSSVCSFGTDYSDKFKELSQFYSILERYRKLEQSTSSTDLRPRLKSENEVIDFDRWREIRLRERAEIELKRLHEELEVKRKEKGFLFKTKEIRDFKWKKEFDRGLRLRDKSVENIKINFERLGRNKEQNLILYADTYKPKWRADSVRDLANKLTQNRSHSADRISRLNHRYITADQFLTHRIGSRIWSSLSIEQVDILKDQLNQIYNHNYTKPKLTYYIPEKQQIPPTTLKIRRNSDSSDCISTTNSNTLSEEDKKRISHSLSREVLDLISRNRKASRSLVFGKETRGAVAVIPTTTNNMEPQKALVTTDAVSPVKLSSASENESGSTDESSKTIVNADGIHKKVEYFEDIAKNDVYVPTVYKPSESAVESEMETQSLKSESDRIFFKLRSNSDDDLRGFYGENSRKSRENLYPSVSTSTESLYRCRSLSPYFGETYKLSKSGEVSKIKKQFEDTNRSKSEDNLDRKNSGDVNALRKTYEFPTGRGRCKSRRGGVVSPVFFRPEDRFMPHINIISKIATLCNKKPHEIARLYDRHKTNEELAKIFGCPVGEVTKLRQKFDSNEKISILGRMFTSSPDIQEIKAIAPYLAAEWTAHKYPYLNDNTRSVSSPEESVGSRDLSLVRRVPRPKSYSPPRPGRPKIIKNYQTEPNKFRSWWPPVPTRHKPTVTFKEPEAPPPPPKGHHGVKNYFDQDSSRKYVENEVTIHYKTPIRQEVKEALSEEELAEKQAEAMKKIYEEEKRRKYFQELHDMNSRRHTDNFVASQKSPIPLNRYDDFVDDLSPVVKQRPRSPEPRLVAKALYNFVGQSPKELSFRKGDIIYIKRQVDKNWFEGEHNAMVGLFPVNYVEVAPYDGVKITPRKSTEGQARAKYNFIAQTHLELSLAKGELVVITRRVDENWFEGRIGGRKGIFPVSYVEVLIDPSENAPNVTNTKPVASPAAHSLLLNGSSGGKESMGSHSYVPSFSRYQEKNYAPQASATYGSLKNPSVQELHVDTHTEAVPYRALYKYCPQNDDELELFEGDTVYVLEKCDDGWYVGSSNRTGAFGTFPGNYVQPV